MAEALAYGDMGLALPILAPGGVASALTHWGSADQQATYLQGVRRRERASGVRGDRRAARAVRSDRAEDHRGAHPSGYRLNGVKSLVPAAADAELFIVGAQLNGKPALFIVESSTQGLSVKADPSMGIRAAALGQVELDNVRCRCAPGSARTTRPTATTRRRSRWRGWAGPHWRSAPRTRCSTT